MSKSIVLQRVLTNPAWKLTLRPRCNRQLRNQRNPKPQQRNQRNPKPQQRNQRNPKLQQRNQRSGRTFPDPLGDNLYLTDASKTWIPTPCERTILVGAVTHCMMVTKRSNLPEYLFSDISQTANIGGALAGGVAAIIGGAKAIPPLWIAGAVATAPSIVSALKAVVTGTPLEASAANMQMTAAGYASLYPNTGLANPDTAYLFYAGLWNAAGTQCPPNLLLGNFKTWSTDHLLHKTSQPGNFEPSTSPPTPKSSCDPESPSAQESATGETGVAAFATSPKELTVGIGCVRLVLGDRLQVTTGNDTGRRSFHPRTGSVRYGRTARARVRELNQYSLNSYSLATRRQ